MYNILFASGCAVYSSGLGAKKKEEKRADNLAYRDIEFNRDWIDCRICAFGKRYPIMKTEKSNLMVFATIAAIVAVIGNFIAAAVLLQTKSNSWLIFSALAVGASLLAAYVTLTASQKQSIEASRTKARVFLSYVREDEEQVDALYKKLQKEGFEPWMDVKRLTAGENWITAIEQAVEDFGFLRSFDIQEFNRQKRLYTKGNEVHTRSAWSRNKHKRTHNPRTI